MNLLFVTVDSFRYDHVTPELMPNLFEECQDHFFFTNATSGGPATISSMTSLFTGEHWNTLTSSDERAKKIFTPHFKKNGYRTYGIQSNTPLTVNPEFRTGFDVYEDTIIPGLGWDADSKLTKFLQRLYFYYRGHPSLSLKGTSDKGLKLLDREKGDFFLWLHYMDPHLPYFLKSKFNLLDKYKSNTLSKKAKKNPEEVTEKEREYLKKAYKKEIKRLDKELGRLIREFKKRDIWEDTVFILTGDHGDAWGIHGRYFHPGDILWEETLHIPLIMRMPGKKGGRIEELVSLLDIKPTLLDMFDLEKPEPGHGESLKKVLEGEHLQRDSVCVFGRGIVAIKKLPWKYILDVGRKKGELYNLKDDPMEKEDLSSKNEKKAEELHNLLKDRIDEFGEIELDAEVPDYSDLDSEVKSRLKALGYMD